MFKRLAKFGLLEPRGIAPGLQEAMPANDNLLGFRRPGGERRIPSPALACHWFDHNGRLECRWLAETNDDAPLGGVDEYKHRTRGRASGQPSMQARGRAPTLAG
jgi:hypothetical protein